MFKNTLCRIAAGLLLVSCNTEKMVDIDYIPVKTGDRWGYVSRDGKYLINPQFDMADVFVGDLGAVKQGEKYGFADRSGQLLNGMLFKDVTPFSEGTAWVVKENCAPTLIDTDGNIVLEMKTADVVHSFSEDLACVGVKNPDSGEMHYGYIDTKGNWAVSPQFDVASDFHEGLAAVGYDSQDGNGYQFGYINTKGKIVIPCQFASADPFAENGTAVVGIRENNSKYGLLFGLIDRKGSYIINPQFSFLDNDGDLYRFRFADADKYGWCDSKGKVVINPQFDSAYGFYGNDLAPISLDSKMFGYADNTGKIVINPQFDTASPFADGMAIVFSNNKAGFIDKEGKYIVNPQFDDVNHRILGAYHGQLTSQWVTSDLFDTDAIATKLEAMMKDGGIGGYSPDMPLGRIIERCGLDSTSISTSADTDIPLFDDMEWTQYASLAVSMRGDFYTEVSDGWWGYVMKPDMTKKPDALTCRITLTDEKADHGRQLFESVKKTLGAKGDGAGKATARRNGTAITIEQEEGTVTVTLTK